MDRSLYVAAVLSTSEGGAWTPVQLQKVFFLLDARIPDAIDGPRFAFYAYDYGPFDPAVYTEVAALASAGQAAVDGYPRAYRLTPAGQRAGEAAPLAPLARSYASRLGAWARGIAFVDLITAVYREYPAMAAKSVFRRSGAT